MQNRHTGVERLQGGERGRESENWSEAGGGRGRGGWEEGGVIEPA